MNQTEDPSWYLIVDGFVLLTCSIGLFVSFIFLLIVVLFYRRIYSAVHLIACNTQMAILLVSTMNFFSIIEVLLNDLHGTDQVTTFCAWRSYFIYTGIALIFYSFVIQSYYGYMRVIHSSKPQYSSIRIICIMIVMQWIFVHTIMLTLPLNNVIDYDSYSHLCFVSLTRYSVLWSLTFFIYVPGYNILSYVYIRLVIYMKKSRQRAAAINASNVRRELEIVKRMVLVLFVFSVAAIPCTTFAIIAIFDPDRFSSHRYRVITLCNCFALASASLIIFVQSTDVRKTTFDRLIRCNQQQRVQPQIERIVR